jgi:hypothetical protein
LFSLVSLGKPIDRDAWLDRKTLRFKSRISITPLAGDPTLGVFRTSIAATA